jgi:hypothetical protein
MLLVLIATAIAGSVDPTLFRPAWPRYGAGILGLNQYCAAEPSKSFFDSIDPSPAKIRAHGIIRL